MMNFLSLRLGVAVLALAVLTVTNAQKAPPKFSNRDMGIEFTHPATWVNVTKRRDKWITYSVPTGSGDTTLQIIANTYRGTVADWQAFQATIAEREGKVVERQWTEEVLSVPLIMTRMAFSAGGLTVQSIDGLLYSRTRRKLQFRITGPKDAVSEAEQQFHDALVTLRMMDGQLPQAEDPNRPETPEDLKPAPGPTRSVPLRDERTARKPRLAPQSIATRAGGRNVALRLPAGWNAELAGELFKLSGSGLAGEATLEVLSTLDSPAPSDALVRASAKSLEDFTKVASRLDRGPFLNQPKADVQWTVRRGEGPGGSSLVRLEAVGAKEGLYWLLRYRAADEGAYRKDKRRLDDLMNTASVEPGT